jgi:hypothetical protein
VEIQGHLLIKMEKARELQADDDAMNINNVADLCLFSWSRRRLRRTVLKIMSSGLCLQARV